MSTDPNQPAPEATPASTPEGGRRSSGGIRNRIQAGRQAIPQLPGSIHQQREIVRGELARKLVRTLNLTLLAILLVVVTSRWTHVDLATAKQFFDPILAAVISLVSSALGFYFGASARAKSSEKEGEED
jgi:hypothetical protein